MHSIWSGSLSFGLVNIPVSLYSATRSQNLELRMLHAPDQSPVHYKKICEQGHEVKNDEIVKGYEYEKDHFVLLDKDDFANANVKKTGSIEIMAFVSASDIDPMYYEQPYYLGVGKGAGKSYALLRDALKESGKVAMARYVLRNREDLAIVRPHGSGLILNQIRYHYELKPDELEYPDVKASTGEMSMALTLIDSLTKKFDPNEYRDTYQEELERVIADKLRGKEIKPHGKEPAPTNVVDLMDMLKKSIASVKKPHPPHRAAKTKERLARSKATSKSIAAATRRKRA